MLRFKYKTVCAMDQEVIKKVFKMQKWMVQFVTLILIGSLIGGCAERKYEVVQNGSPVGSVTTTDEPIDCSVTFKSSGFCVAWSWEIMPTDKDFGSLIFKIIRPNLLDGTAVPVGFESLPSVILWMPSMNHGSVPTHIERVDVGSYRATNVFFIMPGDWEIRFQFKEGDMVQDEAVISLII